MFTQSLLTLPLARGPWVLPPPNGNRRAVQRAQCTVVVWGFLTFEPERHFLPFLRLGWTDFNFFCTFIIHMIIDFINLQISSRWSIPLRNLNHSLCDSKVHSRCILTTWHSLTRYIQKLSDAGLDTRECLAVSGAKPLSRDQRVGSKTFTTPSNTPPPDKEGKPGRSSF